MKDDTHVSESQKLVREIVESAEPIVPPSFALHTEEIGYIDAQIRQLVRVEMKRLGNGPRSTFMFHADTFKSLFSQIDLKFENNPLKARAAKQLVGKRKSAWEWTVRASELQRFVENTIAGMRQDLGSNASN